MYTNIVGNILEKINHEVTMFSLIWEKIVDILSITNGLLYIFIWIK